MKRNFRALLAALALTVGLTVSASAASFTDVASDAWYAEAVREVSAGGVMNGTTETTFTPGGKVTRGMVITVLWRLSGSPAPAEKTSFPDVEEWYYYADAAAWANEQGVTTGLGDGAFGGGDTVTREQLAVFLYRYAQVTGQEIADGVLDIYSDEGDIHAWARDGMAHAVGAGLITGKDDGTLDPGGPATRAQLAVILQRLMTPAVG